MPFRFVYICDLLDVLEKPFLRDVPILARHLNAHNQSHIVNWLKEHRTNLDCFNTSAEVVLSMLKPENQIDRAYGLDEDALERIVARALGLSKDQFVELQKWRNDTAAGDLAACVNRVMNSLPNNALRSFTNVIHAEEIDQALLRIASFNAFSSAEVRSMSKSCKWGHADEVQILGHLYKRLQGREAKWLTRLILKNYGRVKFPDDLSFGANHSSLPSFLSVNVHFPTPASSAMRMEGTSIIKGVKSGPSSSTPPPSSAVSKPTTSSSAVQPISNPETPPTSPLLPSSPAQALIVTQLVPPASVSIPKIKLQTQLKSSRLPLGQLSQNSQNSQYRSSQSNQSAKKSSTSHPSDPCRSNVDASRLKSRILILSPCIANITYITNELLPAHGAYFVTSLSALSSPSTPHRCPQSGKRYRKVVLVESRNTEKTVRFIKSVMRLGLKRKGKREEIEVYDWRLLECLAKVDGGKKLDYDPWKRCWMFAVR